MTAVCSVGLDMIAVPGDTDAETLAALIADEVAIGVINHKTTAVRVIPVPGKGAGDRAVFGGLFGEMAILPIHAAGGSTRLRPPRRPHPGPAVEPAELKRRLILLFILFRGTTRALLLLAVGAALALEPLLALIPMAIRIRSYFIRRIAEPTLTDDRWFLCFGCLNAVVSLPPPIEPGVDTPG